MGKRIVVAAFFVALRICIDPDVATIALLRYLTFLSYIAQVCP